MEESVRLHYLEAMGIDVWVARHPPVAVEPTLTDNDVNTDPREAGQVGIHLPDARQTPEQPASDDSLAEHQLDAPAPQTDERWTAPPIESDAFAPLTHHAKPHANAPAWKDLQHQVSICRACSLCETRSQTVFGVGNKQAHWLLIGEAPGRDEDLQGEPFVGRAGQLLNEMIRAIGLKREQVYIANMLKCRPPNNRDPQADEVAACHDFLKQQIALVQPKIIVAVGRIAAQNLLQSQQPLSKLRGIRHQLEGIPMTVVHHPAYLLRSLPEKAKAWEDLQFALSVYQSLKQ